ncbi:hypothetical protein EZV62_024472 [Acer yangbiense]|uniref:Rx N-terminal domain-containing protein n=1 Tax=Acer yangbiense TaxID=1000413 RepID=A0A5C7GVT3_9ROSI|nr:hypothetical protein EZV62_024472 [Acer yangbiense]
MVDAVVSFVLERLGDFLIQEAAFLGGVGNEAKLLQNELERMQCYIANAEGKQVDDPMIRKWLSDITEISYDIEDVIDKIILQVHEKMTIDLDEEKKPAGGCFGPAIILKQLRRATSFSVEEKIVGFEDDANNFLDTDDVKMKFIRRAWVSVSQEYNTCDLLIRIIHSFGIASVKTDDLKHMTEEELERYLYGSLRGRVYLTVIDDFIRVLDFDGYDKRYFGILYEEIGKLIYLKHLGLRKLGFSQLPSSILKTLDLFSRVAEVELPNKVYKLQELRHLIGLFTGPLQIDSLTKLQSLKFVNNESWSKINPEKLVNLQELSIYSRLCTEEKKLPEDIDVALPNLECLLLKNSWPRDDPMPLLGKVLSFPRLEILKLGRDDQLEEWRVEEGAMPRLRGLSMPQNSTLRIPERLRSILEFETGDLDLLF